MRTSKVILKSLTTAATLLSFGLMIGCDIASTKPSKGVSSATFAITRIDGSAKDNTISQIYGIPETKSVTFLTCMTDVKFNRPVQNQKFSIKEAKQTVETDAAGCLSWTEIIPFNYLADSRYITLTRHINSEGLQVGELEVPFAINLWSHGESLAAVQDPNRVDPQFLIKDSAKSSAYIKAFNASPLWIETARINVLENVVNTQAEFNIEFKTVPSIILKKMNGDVMYRPINVGEFEIKLTWIHVISSEGKEVRRVLAETDWKSAKMSNASLAVPAKLTLKEIPTRGNIYMGVQLKALSSPKDLKPFEGLFMLGDYANIKASPWLISSVISTTDNQFTIEQYLKKSAEFSKFENNYKKAKIEFSEVEMSQVWIESESTTEKSINYKVHTCPFNNVDFRPLVNQKYLVEVKSEDKTQLIPVETDNMGCLNFRDSMTFKVFECPRYIQKTYTFQNKDIGLSEVIPVLVNPWIEGYGFVVDPRFTKLTDKMKTTCQQATIDASTKGPGRGRNEIKLERYSHSTKTYDFSLDKGLNLFLEKKVQVILEPKVVNFETAVSGRNQIHDLRDGLYLLKYAVVKNKSYPQENSVFEASEKIVQAVAHQITAELSFKSDQLKAISNRDQVVLEIYPVKEALIEFVNDDYRPRGNLTMNDIIDYEAGLTSVPYFGNFTLNVDEQARPLWRVSDKEVASWFLDKSKTRNSVSVVEELKAELNRQKTFRKNNLQTQAQKEFFAGSNHLYLVDLGKAAKGVNPLETPMRMKLLMPQAQAISIDDLKSTLDGKGLTTALAEKLCAFWVYDMFRNQIITLGYTQANMVSECKSIVAKDPQGFFNIQKHLFIQESDSKFLVGTNEGLSVGTSFSLARAHSKSFTQSITAAAKIGLSGKLFEFVSLGADVAGSISWAQSESDSDTVGTSVGTATTLMVQKNTFELKVKRAEVCVSIKPMASQFVKRKGFFSKGSFEAYFKDEVPEAQRAEILNRGILICEGSARAMNETVTENFYLINQEFTAGQIQDSGDERNKPFFMALRSDAEYLRFKIAIQANLRHGKTETKDRLGRPLSLEETVMKILDTRKLSGAGVYTY